MYRFDISVRQLAQTTMLSGSIDNRYTGRNRAQEGIKLHKYIQNTYGLGDMAEYTVSYETELPGKAFLSIQGRIDGVLCAESDPVIHEIKSTQTETRDIKEPLGVHLAQCKLYAFIYADTFSLEHIKLKVSYISINDNNVKDFDFELTHKELKEFFYLLCEKYADYAIFRASLTEARNASLKELRFPFDFRPYQKDTVNAIYSAMKKGLNVFAAAPTGSGKTLNALYPAIKFQPKTDDGKIFYLTAKSTQKEVAANAVNILSEAGYSCKCAVLSAKEKSCMLEKPSCNPEDCEYARGYYDRLAENLERTVKENTVMSLESIMPLCKQEKLCPFEFLLDLSMYADIIICDYNYVFNPQAVLKRYFEAETQTKHIFLIDEAHNLADRSREMYSCEIRAAELKSIKKLFTAKSKIKLTIDNILDEMELLRDKCTIKEASFGPKQEDYVFEDIPKELFDNLTRFTFETDAYLAKADRSADGYQKIYDMYFNVVKFLNLHEIRTEAHTFYYEKSSDMLRLFCCEAREFLAERLKSAKSAVFFSATLTPLEYFRRLLGGGDDDVLMDIESIFSQEHFRIAVDTTIDTTYAHRAMYYGEIAKRIYVTKNSREGNYLAYFPSYAFMQSVYDAYRELYPEEEVLLQKRSMNEEARTAYLASFTPHSCVTGFAVSGGVFSEAVDLAGDKLIGCVICGVSLPQICTQRELIRGFYDKKGEPGFDYAYVYPAMTKVLQAMGRVIRTAEDTGCAVLLDKRFMYTAYKRCFPVYYHHLKVVTNIKQLEYCLNYDE